MTPSFIVFTVHGSHAHSRWRKLVNGGYAWWRRWSLFCCELRETLEVGGDACEIREFRWTGHNTFQARVDAGLLLARTIERIAGQTSSSTVCIVAHSHGGSVALEAANHLPAHRIGALVLLATPHMTVIDPGGVPSSQLHWGKAAERIGRIWNLYSPEDKVQCGLVRRFHGIPKTPVSRVQVHPVPQGVSGVISEAVHWDRASVPHSAMHCSVMGRVVGSLLKGDDLQSAMSFGGLSRERHNHTDDRGGYPGLDKTQELIRKRGDGRPFEMGDASAGVGILFLHGFTATPAEMRPMAAALTRRSNWRSKSILLPGHGGTIEDMQQAKGEDWIRAAQAACAQLEQECLDVFVCGLSLGASLACHVALRRGAASRLRGLILIAPAFGVSLKRSIGVRLLRPFKNLRNKGTRASDYFLDHRLNSHLFTPLNLASDVLHLGQEARSRLGELRDLPVLMFAGDLDTTVSLDKIHATARANPWVRFVRLANSRHILTVEPDRETLFETSAQFVEEWVSKCGRSAR